MADEGRIRLARARHRIEQKSQERHFSDEIVLNMRRVYEIRYEQYESEIKKLKNKNNELIAQIEKMKCCENCKHNLNENEYIVSDFCDNCKDYNKWELKE